MKKLTVLIISVLLMTSVKSGTMEESYVYKGNGSFSGSEIKRFIPVEFTQDSAGNLNSQQFLIRNESSESGYINIYLLAKPVDEPILSEDELKTEEMTGVLSHVSYDLTEKEKDYENRWPK